MKTQATPAIKSSAWKIRIAMEEALKTAPELCA
jgi:hypothetical protein